MTHGAYMTRRTFLKLAVVGGAATAGAFVLFKNFAGSSTHACSEYDLDCITSNLVSGGPPRDGIPAINSPVFVTNEQAETNGWVSNSSLVDGIVTAGGEKAYPRSITAWHEIVNDTVDGKPTSLTFCPLTGSAVAYRGEAPDKTPLTFGTTGLLYNSNLVMYDRQTNSMYPQILGIGISGPRKGIELQTVPVTTTTWNNWKAWHPSSLVLSRNTGYFRDYNTYPYGDYDKNDSVYFPVAHESAVFPPKALISGMRIDRETVAVVKDPLRSKIVVDFSVANQAFVALYDPGTDYVRVFSRLVNGSNHTFTTDNSLQVVDNETASRWDYTGVAQGGPLMGTKLQQMSSFQVMWFGWFAFHPSTGLIT